MPTLREQYGDMTPTAPTEGGQTLRDRYGDMSVSTSQPSSPFLDDSQFRPLPDTSPFDLPPGPSDIAPQRDLNALTAALTRPQLQPQLAATLGTPAAQTLSPRFTEQQPTFNILDVGDRIGPRLPQGVVEQAQAGVGGFAEGLLGEFDPNTQSVVGGFATEFDPNIAQTLGEVAGTGAAFAPAIGIGGRVAQLPRIARLATKTPRVAQLAARGGLEGAVFGAQREAGRVAAGEDFDIRRLGEEAALGAAGDVVIRGLGEAVGKPILRALRGAEDVVKPSALRPTIQDIVLPKKQPLPTIEQPSIPKQIEAPKPPVQIEPEAGPRAKVGEELIPTTYTKVKKLRVPEFGNRWYVEHVTPEGQVFQEFASPRFKTKKQANAFLTEKQLPPTPKPLAKVPDVTVQKPSVPETKPVARLEKTQLGFPTPIVGDMQKQVVVGDFIKGEKYIPERQINEISVGQVTKVLKGAIDIKRSDGTTVRLTEKIGKYGGEDVALLKSESAPKAPTPKPLDKVPDVTVQKPVQPPAKPPTPTVPTVKKSLTVETPPSKPLVTGTKASIERVRKDIGVESLEPHQKKAVEVSFKRMTDQELDKNALSIADNVLATKRAITDEEAIGIQVRTSELLDEHEALNRQLGVLKKKGDDVAVTVARNDMAVLEEQIDRLTRGRKLGGTIAGRVGNISQFGVAREGMRVGELVQEVKDITGKPVKQKVRKQLEAISVENDKLVKTIGELEVKYADDLKNAEKIFAEKIAKIEASRSRIAGSRKKVADRARTERADLKKQFAALGNRVNEITGASAEGLFILGKVAKTYIDEGITSLSALTKKVIADFPDVVDDDVYRALNARSPKAQDAARTRASKAHSTLKSSAKLVLEIEGKADNALAGATTGKKSAFPAIRGLKRRITRLQNKSWDAGLPAEDLNKLQQQFTEINEELANFGVLVKDGQKVTQDVIRATRAKIDAATKLLNTQGNIADLNKQFKTGDFFVPEPQVAKVLPQELEKAQVQLHALRRKKRQFMFEQAPKGFFRLAAEIPGAARAQLATADVSYAGRQGALPSISLFRQGRGSRVATTFGKSIKAAFSRNTADQIDRTIRQHPQFWKLQKAGLFVPEIGAKGTPGEEAFSGTLVEKIPGWGEVVKGSERNMVTGLNLLRTQTMLSYMERIPNLTDPELKALADWTNVMSGRGNLNAVGRFAKALNFIFFAPRFAASRVQVPFQIFKHWKLKRVRKEIAKDMASFGAVGASVLGAAALAGQEVGTDPRKSDFGKIKIGNTRVDIFAGVQQPMRLLIGLGAKGSDLAGFTGGNLTEAQKRYDPVEAFGRFASFKLSPGISIPRELITGKTAVGQATTPSETAIRSLMPLFLQDVQDAYRLEGVGQAAWTTALAQLGIGVQTFKKKSRKKGSR